MHTNNIDEAQIILASASPRRKELIKLIAPNAITSEADIEESFDVSLSAEANVLANAQKKADYVQQRAETPNAVVIGADTLVMLGADPLGKPKDASEAFEMLKRLSGKTHEVFTGVCVMQGSKTVAFCERTLVEFFPLSDTQIKKYVETGDAQDKAGAYGIQGEAKLFVKRIDGNYENVVGLPVSRLLRVLTEEFFFTE